MLTLDQARKAARSELAKVETEGADPVAAREQERQGETMRDLCAAYMDRHGNAKKSGREDQRRIDRYLLPKWASLKARAIIRRDVEALHRTMGAAGLTPAAEVVELPTRARTAAK